MTNPAISRRDFVKIAGAAIAAGGFLQAATKGSLKTSLNAYSFNKMLNDNIRKRGPGITLLEVCEFAAKCKFDGFDPTAYFIPGYPELPTDAYIASLKQRAADLGLGISGTGVRNNFTTADKSVRSEGV